MKAITHAKQALGPANAERALRETKWRTKAMRLFRREKGRSADET
jgi:hypothetical protein